MATETRCTGSGPPRRRLLRRGDPVFALAEHLKEPAVFRPEPATDDYQRRIQETRHIPATSMACVPLLSGDVTTGVLGFVKYGDRDWLPEELNALKAIASLFAQLQARVLAEDQLRYLAEHDDLTGLHNRRALLAHLDARLSADNRGRSLCCSSTSTGSRRSTTTSAIPPVTGSSEFLLTD